MFCTNCGHRNPGSANFCSSCGGPLEQVTGEESTVTISAVDATGEPADEEFSVTVDLEGDGIGVLVVKRGPNAGARYLLDKDLVLAGRHPQSDIFLDDITVSRRHAEFVRSDSSYRVRDTGSLNGTYLNRVRIDDAELTAGDEVQIGKYRLVFVASGGDL
ncbi:MAG TPA: FHA domain-containing protein [Acidimicrobiales bacterium]|nr:FHA domain-containing protein [Acidimicrobiales bacterium]